ncbi:MAG: hypothetical protein H6736_22505, partial [Alphaproteobacteria bacterium]|nr:hypothetical protein [Alphaproteobacteria bacterium]
MTPEELFTVANHLAEQAKGGTIPADAGLRAAVGRYYYAALLETREYLEAAAPERVDRSARTHAWVASQLRGADPSTVQLRKLLGDLRSWRTRADYGDDLHMDAGAMARSAQKKARGVLRQVKTLRVR